MMGEGHQEANRRGIREALEWVKQGHMLIVFPAGEVASWSRHHRRVLDPQWNRNMARIARMTGAKSIPAFISGTNSVGFHLAGMIHPRLRTLFLPHELINKRGRRMEVRIGAPVEGETLKAIRDDDKAIDLLRWNSSLLALRDRIGSPRTSFFPVQWQPKYAVAPAEDPTVLLRELQSLPASALLNTAGKMRVYALSSRQAPRIVREIGRLREITFRASGEGTGKPRDLDRFDAYYTHLVLWNDERQEIAGAYRICNVQSVLHRYGMRGLYTAILFRFQPQVLRQGRSGAGTRTLLRASRLPAPIRSPACPLEGHWQLPRAPSGNPDALRRRQHQRGLFAGIARGADQLSERAYGRCRTARSCCAPRIRRAPRPKMCMQPEIFARVFSIDDISDWISMFESDGKGVPVLVRHYMKLGGKFLGFNVDAKFSNVLDGLLLVDLREAKPELLARYLGKPGSG